MSDDLAPVAEVLPILDPRSGELVPLDSATDRLAEAIYNLREYKRDLDAYIQRASDELHRRMDKEATYTYRDGGWEAKGRSPDMVEYDGEALWNELWNLVRPLGLISTGAVERAIEEVTTYKVKRAGVNALRKQGGQIREAIDRTASQVEAPRRVSVKPVEK